jgi:hypothetical protein
MRRRRRSKVRAKLSPGDLRLLHDLAVLRVVIDEPRGPARTRLERKLGPELARALRATHAQAPAVKAA